jgi:hypothetical protein
VQPHPDPKVQAAAEEIQAYLLTEPGASETLQGIVEWWIFRQRFEEAWATVEEALQHLMAAGLVRRTRLADGSFLFARAEKGAPL